MDVVFECFMMASFYAALVVLFARFGEEDRAIEKNERFTVAAIGIGFMIGAVSKWLASPMPWTIILYLWGALFSAVVFVSSFPRKKRKNTWREKFFKKSLQKS